MYSLPHQSVQETFTSTPQSFGVFPRNWNQFTRSEHDFAVCNRPSSLRMAFASIFLPHPDSRRWRIKISAHDDQFCWNFVSNLNELRLASCGLIPVRGPTTTTTNTEKGLQQSLPLAGCQQIGIDGTLKSARKKKTNRKLPPGFREEVLCWGWPG